MALVGDVMGVLDDFQQRSSEDDMESWAITLAEHLAALAIYTLDVAKSNVENMEFKRVTED